MNRPFDRLRDLNSIIRKRVLELVERPDQRK